MSLIKKSLVQLSGNRFIQNMLQKRIINLQYLMGIGSGAGVQSSGEQAIFKVLRSELKPPYCIFDVGSNKGQFLSITLKNLTSIDFNIHCFEPGLETFKTLSSSITENSRVKLNNIGLGKESRKALLHYDNAGSGLASLTKRKLDHFNIDFSKSEEVVIDTIDNYCSVNGIDHIDLLKIDIEGHELDALSGANNMFSSKSIDMVTFEFGGCNIDTRSFFQDFWYFFKDTDFTIYRITPSGYMYPLTRYIEIYEQFRTTNYMAIANK